MPTTIREQTAGEALRDARRYSDAAKQANRRGDRHLAQRLYAKKKSAAQYAVIRGMPIHVARDDTSLLTVGTRQLQVHYVRGAKAAVVRTAKPIADCRKALRKCIDKLERRMKPTGAAWGEVYDSLDKVLKEI